MKFSKIVAEKQSKEALTQFVRSKKIPHAVLISGHVGYGALPLALAYAAYIQCEEPIEDEACGVCKACKKTFQFIHPDVHFSFPFMGANNTSDDFIKSFRVFLQENPFGDLTDWLTLVGADNKQVNINTKECRNIIKKFSFQTFESPNKVLVMWLPEFLRKEGNRLLKMIEEPTDNTYFVLVTQQIQDILPTIISRCQVVNVKPIQSATLELALREKYQLNDAAIKEIAFMAEGNWLMAQQLCDQKAGSLADEVLVWFRTCYSCRALDMNNWVESFAKKNKEEQKTFLRYTQNLFREILRIPFLEEKNIRLRENELQTAKKIAGIITFEYIGQLVSLIDETIYHLERNANVRILMLDVGISFKNILRACVKSSK